MAHRQCTTGVLVYNDSPVVSVRHFENGGEQRTREIFGIFIVVMIFKANIPV
jgi:hypothetical protein